MLCPAVAGGLIRPGHEIRWDAATTTGTTGAGEGRGRTPGQAIASPPLATGAPPRPSRTSRAGRGQDLSRQGPGLSLEGSVRTPGQAIASPPLATGAPPRPSRTSRAGRGQDLSRQVPRLRLG